MSDATTPGVSVGGKMATRQRVQTYRDALRAEGLRPVQTWVLDTTRPGFAEDIKKQCLSLRDDPQEAEILKWVEQAWDTTGWV